MKDITFLLYPFPLALVVDVSGSLCIYSCHVVHNLSWGDIRKFAEWPV